jgi:hypothetical protein
MLQNCKIKEDWRTAAPSCVWPETAAVNCRRLARSVPEVGLYLLETASCLAYGPDDLPQKTCGLRYHAHLPLDLPWRLGGYAVAEAITGLLDKIGHLAPWGFVLHPPEDRQALEEFVAAWTDAGRDSADLLLENTEAASPTEVLDLVQDLHCGLCLDLGHMLAMDHPLPDAVDALAARTRMLHVYSPFGAEGPPPGRRHAHRPLTSLSPGGRDLLVWLLGNLRPETVVVEVFSPIHLQESLAVLDALAEAVGAGA